MKVIVLWYHRPSRRERLGDDLKNNAWHRCVEKPAAGDCVLLRQKLNLLMNQEIMVFRRNNGIAADIRGFGDLIRRVVVRRPSSPC